MVTAVGFRPPVGPRGGVAEVAQQHPLAGGRVDAEELATAAGAGELVDDEEAAVGVEHQADRVVARAALVRGCRSR
jgi:hypothetical protein